MADHATDVRGVLLKAADHIARYGWHQGDFCDAFNVPNTVTARQTCPVCASGAIRVVVTGNPSGDGDLADAAEAAFLQFVRNQHDDLDAPDLERDDHTPVLIGHWNDAPRRTQDEVIAALREAAEQVSPNA